jgi:hypothetical protein
MKYFLIASLLFIEVVCSSQDKLNAEYYNSTVQSLKNDPRFCEVVFRQKKYGNGKIESQEILVKFKNDHIYFSIGKYYSYYKNGKLRGYQNIDIKTNVAVDTTKEYNADGSIYQFTIWGNHPKEIQMWRIGLFSKNYERLPSDYKTIVYQKGGKRIEQEYIENKENGYEIVYINDLIEAKTFFKDGKKVK